MHGDILMRPTDTAAVTQPQVPAVPITVHSPTRPLSQPAVQKTLALYFSAFCIIYIFFHKSITSNKKKERKNLLDRVNLQGETKIIFIKEVLWY